MASLLTDEEFNKKYALKIVIKTHLCQSDVLTIRLLNSMFLSVVKTVPLDIIAKSTKHLKEINQMIHLNRITIGILYYTFTPEEPSDISNVTHLHVNEIIPENLPLAITQLTLTLNDSTPDFSEFPSAIKYLSLVLKPNGNSNGIILPLHLTHLSLENFNQVLNKQNLGPYLTHLTLGEGFNQPLDSLPKTLTHLIFSSQSTFNQPIDHLPSTLIHLELGMAFNKPIDHLPSTLSYLKLGKNFNQNINHLPLLIHLDMEDCEFFNKKSIIYLPHSSI